jgi:hypothetical protein
MYRKRTYKIKKRVPSTAPIFKKTIEEGMTHVAPFSIRTSKKQKWDCCNQFQISASHWMFCEQLGAMIIYNLDS